MTHQLTLEMPLIYTPSYSRDDFVVTENNADVIALIDSWPQWRSKSLLLLGDQCSGKTYVASIWGNRTRGHIISAPDVVKIQDLSVIEQYGAIVIEDIHLLVGDAESLTALLHLVNYINEREIWMLLTSEAPPAAFDAVPALASRLHNTSNTCLSALVSNESDFEQLIVKLSKDFQIDLPPNCARQLTKKLPKDLSHIMKFFRAAHCNVGEYKTFSIARMNDILEKIRNDEATDL